MAECGKGWTGRCSAAKSKKCRCRCGGVNHGATRQKFEDNSPRRSSDEELYYGYDEKKRRAFLPMAATVQAVKFTRLAGEPSSTPGIDQRGKPVVELVFPNQQDTLRHRYMRHSPDGFEWGYAGSGPAELALNLLAEFVGVKNATEEGMYQDFKFDFIAKISQEEGGTIAGDDIVRWVRNRWADMAVKEQEAAELA